MDKKNLRLLVIIFLITTSTPKINSQEPTETLPLLAEMNIAINFINFDLNLLDLTALQSNFENTQLYRNYGSTEYNIIFELNTPDQDYTESLNNYIDTITSEDWTSRLNETAILEQRAEFTRKDIFEQQYGKAVDARLLEQYLSNNKPTTTLNDNNLYHIFVFNLSRLDVGANKHWLNVTEIDPDSMSSRFYWRLEWDYPMNYDVKFPYAAFSEQSDIAIIDPTSFQWVLNWRRYWNTDTVYHQSYDKTLTELITSQTIEQARNTVTDTTSKWVGDWLNRIYGMSLMGDEPKLGGSTNAQFIVGYNSSQKSRSEIEWIINEQLVSDELGFIANSTDVDIIVNYYDVKSDHVLQNILRNAEIDYQSVYGTPPFENWTYYDGIDLFNAVVVNSELNNNYFIDSTADIPVKGIILILDNASYASDSPSLTPWTGGLFTGLGGGGIVTMLWELDRAFMPNGVTHKAGLSKVLIHEIGHSIGLPHTFTNSFVSDFISDVMGYYPGTANFSTLISQSFWRRNVDNKIQELLTRYQETYLDYTNYYPNIVSYVFENYKLAMEIHAQKKYLELIPMIEHLLHVLNFPEQYTSVSEYSSEFSNDFIIPNSKEEELTHNFGFSLLVLIPIITIKLIKKRKF
ncbi:MAG: hypothetical protein OEY49_00530 [Candidatus Heimdallarchaeota archaeon]|nr:hypothetical protein [Candidatus Heimdallarchaeota archaeon]